MNPPLLSFFEWLLRASGQAAVLTVLVLLARFLLRKRLDARWKHLLWLLVLVRLVMPLSPPSPSSLFNYIRVEPKLHRSVAYVLATARPTLLPPSRGTPPPGSPESPAAASLAATPQNATATSDGRFEMANPSPPPRPPTSSHPAAKLPAWPVLLELFWALGVALLTARVIAQNVLFSRRLRDGRALDDPEILAIFGRCKSAMGVRAGVELIQTDAVRSPALYGLLRVRLLLPPGLTRDFDAAELRHVFLHELAHVRRRDIAVQWLVMCCQILHWFNPILWLGFQKLAADREMACDELALSVAGPEHGKAYGQTIVKLVETFSQAEALPGLVGILEDKEQIYQRISMIACFKRRPKWSLVGAAVAVGLALATLTGAQQGGSTGATAPPVLAIGLTTSASNREITMKTPTATTAPPAQTTPQGAPVDLTGTVFLTNGQPASATVFIYTAALKEGTSGLSPRFYPDCRKSAKTDAQGHFKIEALDSQLKFQLLVLAKDCKPTFVPDVDPDKDPIHVVLPPRNSSIIAADCIVRGRLTGPKGEPIRDAVIEPDRSRFKDGGQEFQAQEVDALAVTDDDGRFTLTARKPLARISLRAEAPGYARRSFQDVNPGERVNELQLTEGAALKGRVMLNGRPLPRVGVGVMTEDRRVVNFCHYQVRTDGNGQFTFPNLPPNLRYSLYTTMSTTRAYGAARIAGVNAGNDGTVTDAGDLVVEPARRVSGRVVLDDGQLIPAGTRLLVARRNAWDSQEVALGVDGSFSIDGIPSDAISLSVGLKGYRPSAKNVSLGPLNPYLLVGLVKQDIADFVMLLEKGAPLQPHYDSTGNMLDQPENRPLAGAEHASDHVGQILISGNVVDVEGGHGIARFRVTPGRDARFGPGAKNWNSQLAVDAVNGVYQIYLTKSDAPFFIKAEAPGYLPAVSPALYGARTSVDFILHKGTGPAGVVLLPDGKPASRASVALICQVPQENKIQLRAGGTFGARGNERDVVLTDDAGHFSFPPELEMKFVAAAAAEGFAMVPIEALQSNTPIRMERWGKVKGVLRRAGVPSINETLYLTFGGSLKERGLGMSALAHTDKNGAFEFNYAPAGECEILVEEPSENMLDRLNVLRTFHAEAGETVILNPDVAKKSAIDPKNPRRPSRLLSSETAPSKTLQGFVVRLDGSPIAGAGVGFASERFMVHIGDGKLIAGMTTDGNTEQTTASGSFTVPWPASASTLYAACDAGAAARELDGLSNGVKIILQPRAKVEGTLRLNNQVAPGERIRLQSQNNEFTFPPAYLVESTTDENGHFAFDHVLPGTCELTRWVQTGRRLNSTTSRFIFDTRPGETTNISWGGNGRPVTLQVVAQPSNDQTKEPEFTISIHTPYPMPRGPASSGSPRQTAKDISKWRQSAEGKAAMRAHREYTARPTNDRVFQADDVLPGKYMLTVNCRIEHEPGQPGARTETFQVLNTNIVIPPLNNPAKCEPFDLGSFEVNQSVPKSGAVMYSYFSLAPPGSKSDAMASSRVPKPGVEAPDFETKTLDGNPLRLADYRGKFVLLDLRYMLPGQEMEGIQSVNNTFGKDDRFATISLCQNWSDSYVKHIKNEDAAHWIVGDLDFAAMSPKYGLEGAVFPVILLVGPDGKVLKSQLRGDDIYASVAEALAKK